MNYPMYFSISSIISILLLSCGSPKLHRVDSSKIDKNKTALAYIKATGDLETVFPNSYVNLKDFLPLNYSAKGNVDYTAIIQNVLDNHTNVLFPDFPLLVNDKGLVVRSNSTLFFPEGSQLRLAPSSKVWYTILAINKVENVKIYNPNIEGDRYRRLDPTSKEGEWGMGIWLASASNVQIYNPKVEKCWGDGIYFGKDDIDNPNNDISILNAIIDDNRRNGISITCGKNVTIKDAVISNTQGKSPQAGIDIEPNTNDDIIENIRIENPHTIRNAYMGICVSLGSMVGEKAKNVNIDIINHVDEYTPNGFVLASIRRDRKTVDKNLLGAVRITNPEWRYNKYPCLLGITRGLFPSITIKDPVIYRDDAQPELKDLNVVKAIQSKTFDGILNLELN